MKNLPAMTGLAFSLLAGAYATTADAQPVLRASCTQGGRIVNREDLAPGAGVTEKMIVAARFPEALCVFVQNDDANNSVGYVQAPPVEGRVSSDTDLATALAMISEGRQSTKLGEGIPVDLSAVMQPLKSKGSIPDPTVASTINLTIGIYKDMSAEDVMAHWKVMQRESVTLQRMTPTLTKAKEITMLSVENVPDASADQVCKEAEKTSSGCIAYY
jgi:hypothetical protein